MVVQRRRVIITVAAIVIIVLATVVLVSGMFPGFRPFAISKPDTPVTESQAVLAAGAVVTLTPGGPWSLFWADGNANTLGSIYFNETEFNENSSCALTGGIVQNAPMGPYSGDYAPGAAALWILQYSSPVNNGSLLVVQVEEGVASKVGTISGSGCLSYSQIGSIGSVIDSSVAMRDVLSTPNGSRFAALYSRGNSTLILGSPTGDTAQPGPPVWDIWLDACATPPDHGAFPGTFFGSVWAANGTIQDEPRGPPYC
jgi:hypothetical protein